jgi:PhnB protein
MHATIRIGDAVLAGGDPPPHQYVRPQGFSLLLETNDSAEAERAFQALSENATIEMPLQETFWAKRFGSLVDQFGIPWSINCE